MIITLSLYDANLCNSGASQMTSLVEPSGFCFVDLSPSLLHQRIRSVGSVPLPCMEEELVRSAKLNDDVKHAFRVWG